MNIGIYGGSFDPIHRGHIEPVLEAKAAAGLDRVIYLPTARPPHKQGRRMAPAEHRFAMVELALGDFPGLEVSDYEMGLDRPAYTVETLEHFHDSCPEDQLSLIIGADSFLQLENWYRYQRILELARLVVMVRPGRQVKRSASQDPKEGSELPAVIRRLLDDPTVIWVENREIAASSTEIRRRLSTADSELQDWLPEQVLNYIRTYGLYAE